jgi:hypothetical protein
MNQSGVNNINHRSGERGSSSSWGGGSPSPLGSLMEYGAQPLSQQRWMIRGTFYYWVLVY